MDQKDLSQLTDEELLAEAKKMKSAAIINAVFIGVMIGIIIYSIVENSIGFLTLLPLYLAYKAFDNSKNNKRVEELLKERNLK